MHCVKNSNLVEFGFLTGISKIYVLDPHCIGVFDSVINVFLRRFGFRKFNYLSEAISRGELGIVYSSGSSFALHKIKFELLVRFLRFTERIAWRALFGVNVKFVNLLDLERGATLIVDTNVRGSFCEKNIKIFNEKQLNLKLYCSHFTHDFLQKKKLLEKIDCPCGFFAESALDDLVGANVAVVPYFAAPRFFTAELIEERVDKVLVVGTVNFQKDAGLREFFGADVLHPFRNRLFLERDVLNFTFNIARNYTLTDNSYYNLDLPSFYQRFKFFICPEDVSGQPSSNMAEGMAGGCIYFANERLGYMERYGMLPYEHFLPYDGTLGGLEAVYSNVRFNRNLLERMSENSRSFAISHFSSYAVEKNLFDTLAPS